MPHGVDGPSPAASGDPTTSRITSPNRKKTWRIGRPPSSASRSRRASTPTPVSACTVRPRSGENSTTWSMPVTPLRCSAGIDRAASDLVVGMPSRFAGEPSGSPRRDQPTMPVPATAPVSRMSTPPTRQTSSESTVNPARLQASGGSATSISATVMAIVEYGIAMRWLTFRDDSGQRTGVLSGDTIHVLPDASLLDLIADGRLTEAGEQALASTTRVPLDQVTLMAPIPRPPSIRDSLCFLDHMRNCQAAMGGGRVLKDTWYRIPAFYFACPSTVLGPYDDASMAPGSAWQDFELEIAAFIGTAGKDLSVADAEQAIIGYMIFNDWSARDLQQLEGQLAIGQAKGKDSGVTLGPYLVTPDELEPFRRDGKLSLEVTAMGNDEVIGTGSTAAMGWSFAEVIACATRGVKLAPGDVFGSGTVPTCTLVEHLDPTAPESFRGWLRDGDVVTLTVQGLGETRQTVRKTPAPQPLSARPNPDAAPSAKRVNSAKAKIPYTRGLHEVSDRVWAWMLPDGGYGWSNAGLVAGDGASLLVDTLFDLPLTREMLTAMTPVTDRAPITDALITHSNGDHA